jgi:subtilisin family serine protease
LQHQILTRLDTPTELPWYLNKKIKIAIIDSGARKTDSLVLGAKNGGKLEGRNFQPGPPEQWDDTHGHGTHIARILLEMAPEANLYVAKVTSGQRIEQDMISSITDAVNWAVQVWDVDIISLSLVIPEKNEKLEEALTQAMNPGYNGGRRRILFAAAGNTGGNRPMGWLATLPNIIAIHATDGLGAPANFNPTSLSGVSFATLGQGEFGALVKYSCNIMRKITTAQHL